MAKYVIAQFQTLFRVKGSAVNNCMKITSKVLVKLRYMVNLPLSNVFGDSKDTS